MRKRLLIGLSLLLLLAAGFALGMLVQWRVQLGVEKAKAKFTENIIRQFAGDGGSIPPPPPVEELQYPGAHSDTKHKGLSQTVMGKEVRAAGHYQVWLTPDDYDKVIEFYRGKAGFKEKGPTSPFDQSSEGALFAGEAKHLLSDNLQDPASPAKTRPVRVLCLVRRSRSHDLTVFVTRAEGEKYTHVVLLHEPRAVGEAKPE